MKIMLIFLAILLNPYSSPSLAGITVKNSRTFNLNQALVTDNTSIEYFDIKHYPNLNFEKDELGKFIGAVYPPKSIVRQSKFLDGVPIFQAEYKIGEYGLRIFSGKNGPHHVIIAGDSNVFGEGCNDKETMFDFLDKTIKDAQFYNYGHRGGGPHNTLSLIEHYPALLQVKQKSGLFMYNFFPGHMTERVIGAKNYIGWDLGLSPWYSVNEKDELIYNGPFSNRSMTRIYKWIADSSFLNKLFPSLPRVGQAHYHLIAKIFERMKQVYLHNFPAGQFVVVLNELSSVESEANTKLKMELDKLHVDAVVLKKTVSYFKSLVFIDGHFNPEGQRMEASRLSEVIFKNLSSSASDRPKR